MGRAIILHTAVAAAMFLPIALPVRAAADVITISGNIAASTDQTGATYAGTIEYSTVTPDAGRLIVSLTNTTPAATGGFLTGFVFNIPSADPLASAVLALTDTAFLDTGPESGSPFGDFTAGAALDASFLGGGSPAAGLAPGQSGSFTFTVSASDAGSLAAAGFLGNPADHNFVVRFKGLSLGRSDKVPAVPTPGTLVLAAAGGLLLIRRKRSSAVRTISA